MILQSIRLRETSVVIDALIDAGAILAILNRSDVWQKSCVQTMETLRLPLLTSEAVLTELFHLLGDHKHQMEAGWHFIRSGAITVESVPQDEFVFLQRLMSKYADCPMDYADATLVHLGIRHSISTIFTVDLADFETCRLTGTRRFRIVPGRRA